MYVIKKDNRCVPFDFEKIKSAVSKSADRVNISLSDKDFEKIEKIVKEEIAKEKQDNVPVSKMHNFVECALDKVNKDVAKSYRDYRNYKHEFVQMMDNVLKTADEMNYKIDRSNANTSAALVSTKRSMIYSALNKEIYKNTFLNKEELAAINDGYIYIHDLSARLDTANCFARETEFMTTDGLRSFADFNDGDIVTVFDAFGQVQQATVHNYGKQRLNKVVLKRCSKGYQTVYVTANHRWLLKNGKETIDLKVGDKLMLAPSVHFKTAEEMTQKEAFAWSCGFILADGSAEHYKSKNGDCDRDYSMVRLCGQKKKFAPVFIKAGLNVTYPKNLKGDGYVYCRNFAKKNFNREEMNKYSLNELKMMAQGYMSADGHLSLGLRPMGHFRGVQASGSNNDWLLDLLSIGGFYVTSEEDLTGRQTNYGERKFTIKYQLHDNQGCRGYVVQSIEPAYEDEVWCLDVQNSHSFLLKGGIPTGNCCLFDMGKVLQGGFEWEHIGYNEPKDVRTAGNLISDITLNCAAQQYGGFTIPEIDSILAPYAEKSYNRYVREYKSLCEQVSGNYDEHAADQYAIKKVERDLEQVFQGFEHTFNTVASSRGDYPFITITGGCDETRFGTLVWSTALKVRREGQGHPGHKRPAIFPKMVFLYTKQLHGEGKPLEWLFNEGVKTSCAAMYPDWLSLDEPDETLIKGVHAPHYEPQIANVFKKYHKFGVSRWYLDKNENVQENPEWVDSIISPMGCRAYLSAYYEKGGLKPANDEDKPIFTGRFNGGAISLNLPMIYEKSVKEKKDFYEVLDYYLNMINNLHIKTFNFLCKLKASCNPVGYCEGGFGHLKPSDDISSLVKRITFSYGFTALNELQELYNGKSLYEVRNDENAFAYKVLKYIGNYVDERKVEYQQGKLPYIAAIYATPAESLCGTQREQFVKKYGIVHKVSDRAYFTNSFHMHVTENITPYEKQDAEFRYFHLASGGHIQYCRFVSGMNEAYIKQCVRRAMKLGYYFGVNIEKSYCEDCGNETEDDDTVCGFCGSQNLTTINRVCGYLGYSKVEGTTKMNDAKMAEVKDRKSM